jgi:hypothetical protein
MLTAIAAATAPHPQRGAQGSPRSLREEPDEPRDMGGGLEAVGGLARGLMHRQRAQRKGGYFVDAAWPLRGPARAAVMVDRLRNAARYQPNVKQ